MIPSASSFLAFDDGRLTVVEVAAVDRGWADRVLAERPDARLQSVPIDRIASLDEALAEIRHVNYLRIADPAAALPVLIATRRLLSHARIDLIEIVAGPAAAPLLEPINALLQRYDFMLLPPGGKLDDLLLTPCGAFGSAALVALHRRFTGAIAGGDREPDLGALMAAHHLTPRGIIHIGAHHGQEVPAYLACGFARLLLIEADPGLAAMLTERFRDEPRVTVASCAVTDHNGTVELHLASSSASTSILALKQHAAVFPEIHEIGRIAVRGRTLDSLLDELGCGDGFNILVIDIQGAELLGLRGAAQLLSRLEGLLVEVNFAELYHGGAQIEDVDDLLSAHGFARLMTMSPYQSSFGDAFYVRTR